MKYATRKVEDAENWVLVTVYHPNAFQDRKPPVVNVYGYKTKREARNHYAREMRAWKKEIRNGRPGVLKLSVQPVLTDDMFGLIPDDWN